MRSFTVLIGSLTMALAAFSLAVAAPRNHDFATLDLEQASGSLRITNSQAGQALLTATDMRPGDGVSGTVRIGNDGDIAGRFGVRTEGIEDTPGPFGGRLSERIELVLFDVTNVQQPLTLFAGHPAEFGQVDLGTFAAGESREYVLAATLPDGGTPNSNTGGDNLYQGSGIRLDFVWQAGTVAAPTPVPTPASTPTPKPKPTPTAPKATPTPAPTVTADTIGLPAASSCVKRGRLKFKLKFPAGVRIVSATVAVNGRVKARLKGSKLRKPVSLKRLRKSTKLKVTLRASGGRTYTTTRTYRACKR
jgi:spore coat-associated protein N